MAVRDISFDIRTGDFFYTIDLGFVNRRLCMSALSILPEAIQDFYREKQKPGSHQLTVLENDRLLINILLDVCRRFHVQTLPEVLALGETKKLFLSTQRLAPCKDIDESSRVDHLVELDIDFGKPVHIAYHVEHLVSTTGKERLAQGTNQSVVGFLHNKADRFEIEPLVIGTPLLDDQLNPNAHVSLPWNSGGYGEILPEDINQFSKMVDVTVDNADEWMNAMRDMPEKKIKQAFASRLCEPTKKDWGGESNDHYSANVRVGDHRKTAAFLLKGPGGGKWFKEMTLDMCGKRADQILRLKDSHADILIVQHCHLIGQNVRKTLRCLAVCPGRMGNGNAQKYCLIDGQATYQILKAYELL